MRLFVTGGAGFIGSAYVRKAISLGHEVVNVDCLTHAGNLNNLNTIISSPRHTFECVDICDEKKVEKVFEKYLPDCVIHLAAESHVDQSISSPKQFLETNILGTFVLLEASRKYRGSNKCPASFRFHHVSTDEVYGSLDCKNENKFDELTRYDPRNPYSATKAASDHLVRAWYHTHGLPIIVTNCSNNYGPYQSIDKLIPLMITNALVGKPLTIYGDGSNVRDWLFVDDHVEALFAVLAKGKVGETYNIGGGNEYSNIQVVSQICKILDAQEPRVKGQYADLIEFVDDRLGHDKYYAVNANKLISELSWKPKTDFFMGLETTIGWYRKNRNWWNI